MRSKVHYNLFEPLLKFFHRRDDFRRGFFIGKNLPSAIRRRVSNLDINGIAKTKFFMKLTFNNWYNEKMYATEELAAETNRAEELLEVISAVAIVGLSRSFHKDSQYIGRYLKDAGYQIVPVNPNADEILDKKAYPDLKSIPFEIDAVDVFLPKEAIPEAVDQAIEIDPVAIWLQLGTGKTPEQKRKAEEAGIPLFENRCIKVDHQFLIRPTKEKDHN